MGRIKKIKTDYKFFDNKLNYLKKGDSILLCDSILGNKHYCIIDDILKFPGFGFPTEKPTEVNGIVHITENYFHNDENIIILENGHYNILIMKIKIFIYDEILNMYVVDFSKINKIIGKEIPIEIKHILLNMLIE